MSVKTPIRPDVTTVIDKLRPCPGEPRKTCHTLRADGSALCNAWGPSPGGADARPGLHSSRTCREQGHRHCVLCTELHRQLGDNGMVRA